MVKKNAQTVLLMLTLFLSLSTIACNAPHSPRETSGEPLRVATHPVPTVLSAQEIAWNEADIESLYGGLLEIRRLKDAYDNKLPKCPLRFRSDLVVID